MNGWGGIDCLIDEHAVKKRNVRRLWPQFLDFRSGRGIHAKDTSRKRIHHHADQLGRRLPGVQRYDNDAVSHQREIESNPPGAIWSDQHAPITLLQATGAQELAGPLHHREQLAARNLLSNAIMDFDQDLRIRDPLETFEDRFQKCHMGAAISFWETSTPL